MLLADNEGSDWCLGLSLLTEALRLYVISIDFRFATGWRIKAFHLEFLSFSCPLHTWGGCESDLGSRSSTWQRAELSWQGWQIIHTIEHLQVTFFLEQVGSGGWERGWNSLSHNFFPSLLWRCYNYLLSQTWAIEHRLNLALNKEEIMSLRKIVPFHEPIFLWEDTAYPQNFCKQHRRQMYNICDKMKWLNCLLQKN